MLHFLLGGAAPNVRCRGVRVPKPGKNAATGRLQAKGSYGQFGVWCVFSLRLVSPSFQSLPGILREPMPGPARQYQYHPRSPAKGALRPAKGILRAAHYGVSGSPAGIPILGRGGYRLSTLRAIIAPTGENIMWHLTPSYGGLDLFSKRVISSRIGSDECLLGFDCKSSG